MKKLVKVLGIIGLGVLFAVGNASATPMDLSELQGVLDDITVGGPSSVNVETDMLDDNSDSYWEVTATGTTATTFIYSLGAGLDLNAGLSFGIYQGGQTIELFNGDNTVFPGLKTSLNFYDNGKVYKDGALVGTGFASNIIGYYLETPDVTFYSDSDMNDGFDAMLAYRGVNDRVKLPNTYEATWTPNEYILAWEGLIDDQDMDYTDLMVMVESVEPTPEPATMLLLGSGLVGLAAAGRRKRLARA